MFAPFRVSIMTLTAPQREAVAKWVAAGDSLAVVQRKLTDEFKLSLTYMEVRFLVDDLGLELKSPPPTKPAAVPAELAGRGPAPAAGAAAPKKGLFDKLKDAVGGKRDDEAVAPEADEAELAPEEAEAELAEPELPAGPAGTGAVKLEVDRIGRPGTLVSGSVTFSDGVSGKWAMDQYGRLMVDAGKGYKPSQADIQAFQAELGAQLQRLGY